MECICFSWKRSRIRVDHLENQKQEITLKFWGFVWGMVLVSLYSFPGSHGLSGVDCGNLGTSGRPAAQRPKIMISINKVQDFQPQNEKIARIKNKNIMADSWQTVYCSQRCLDQCVQTEGDSCSTDFKVSRNDVTGLLVLVMCPHWFMDRNISGRLCTTWDCFKGREALLRRLSILWLLWK